jgi:hypothetical protein
MTLDGVDNDLVRHEFPAIGLSQPRPDCNPPFSDIV